MGKPKAETLSAAFEKYGAFKELPGAICPHCGATAAFRPVGTIDSGGHRLPGERRVGLRTIVSAAVCVACGRLVVGVYCRAQLSESAQDFAEFLWPPQVWPDNGPENLDDEVRRDYDEARQVLANSARASAMLVRRCLQQVIRTRLGIERRFLWQEIEEAAKRNELSQLTRKALDHVRQIGNWSAHPCAVEGGDEGAADEATGLIDVTREDAEYTLGVLEMLFQDLYIAPDRQAAMQSKIEGMKKGAEE